MQSDDYPRDYWPMFWGDKYIGNVSTVDEYQKKLSDYHVHPADVRVVGCPYVHLWGLQALD
jgi:hypothetical protein